MHVRQIVTVYKLTRFGSPAKGFFDTSPLYFDTEEAAYGYVHANQEFNVAITQEKAFECDRDPFYASHKKQSTRNYRLLQPSTIIEEQIQQGKSVTWGYTVENGMKHYVSFTPAVEAAIKENPDSVIILNKTGASLYAYENQSHHIDHFAVYGQDDGWSTMLSYLYVETKAVNGASVEVRSFINENCLIRVETDVNNVPQPATEKTATSLPPNKSGCTLV